MTITLQKFQLILFLSLFFIFGGFGFKFFASASEISVYLSEKMPFKYERLVWNTVRIDGDEIKKIFRIPTEMNDFENNIYYEYPNSIYFGFSDKQFADKDEYTKIDFPVGTVEYAVYKHKYKQSITVPIYDDIPPILENGWEKSETLERSDVFCFVSKKSPELQKKLENSFRQLESINLLEKIKSGENAGDSKVVFQISSYNDEMVWAKQGEDALRKCYEEFDEPVSIYVHNMNFRRVNNPTFQYSETEEYIRATFMYEYPDVIVVADNAALEFLNSVYSKYFYGVPVVFCGINDFNDSLIDGFDGFVTGITEIITVSETINFALKQNPDITQIYLIFDSDPSSYTIQNLVCDEIKTNFKDLKIINSNNESYHQVIDRIGLFSENNDTIILIGAYCTDSTYRFIPEPQFSAAISKISKVPIYCMASSYAGNGVLGGKVSDSVAFNREAALITQKILKGTNVQDIPIIMEDEVNEKFTSWIIDRSVADKYKISKDSIPKNSIILNQKQNFIQLYPVQTTIFCLAIVGGIAVSIYLYFLSVKVKEANKELTEARKKLSSAEETASRDKIIAEKSNEANKFKNVFLTNISHELRTPVNAIMGFAEAGLAKSTGYVTTKNSFNSYISKQNSFKNSNNSSDIIEKKNSYFVNIISAAKRLTRIANDIIDLSKIEQGDLSLKKVDFDFYELMKSTSAFFQTYAEEKNITFISKIEDDIPAALYGDDLRYSQIIGNILSNAINFTPSGGTVEIHSKFLYYDEKGYALIETLVKDNGVGIDEKNLQNIFSPFSNTRKNIEGSAEGSGLGLALAHNLAKLVGGGVKVSSALGKGSEFYVTMRFERSNMEDEKNGILEQTTFPDKTILVVDDIDINILVMEALLEDSKINILQAMDGEKAIEVLKQNPQVDLIFMDIQMPGMDGYTTAEKIRELDEKVFPSAKTVPIAALTANVLKSDVDKSIAAGMNEHLSKPVEAEKIFSVLNKYFS